MVKKVIWSSIFKHDRFTFWFQTYLERKGPRTCEQLHSFIHGNPRLVEERAAIGTYAQLLDILKTHGSFHILDNHKVGHSKHKMIGLAQHLDGGQISDSSVPVTGSGITLANTYKRRKRKFSGKDDVDVGNKPAKKPKTMKQPEAADPHLLSAMKKFRVSCISDGIQNHIVY